jgi:hypothetical protein
MGRQMGSIYYDVFHTNLSRRELDADPEVDSTFNRYLGVLQPYDRLPHDTVIFTPGGMRAHVVGDPVGEGEVMRLHQSHFPASFHTILFGEADLGMESAIGGDEVVVLE